jgi:hypothetical protein
LFHLKERALGKSSEQFFDIGFVRDGFINGEPVDGELVESVEPPRQLLSNAQPKPPNRRTAGVNYLIFREKVLNFPPITPISGTF